VKKIIIFGSILLALFAAISFLTSYQQNKKAEDNPFKKESLHPATIEQLDDPNYQNIILPDELDKKLAKKESVTVYFYSPTCPHCRDTTPVVAPLSKELGIDLKMFNLLEFEEGWDKYNIEATPTIVHYIDGKEVKRIDGYRDEAAFRDWFNSIRQ